MLFSLFYKYWHNQGTKKVINTTRGEKDWQTLPYKKYGVISHSSQQPFEIFHKDMY